MKKKATLITAIIAVVFIVLFFDSIVSFVINIQWFKDIGYLPAYFTKLKAMLKLMIPTFLVTYIAIWLYYRSIKKCISKWNNVEQQGRKNIERKLFRVINAVISLGASFIFSRNYWERILQFSNSVSFNVKDPIFNKDVSFYVFKLPLVNSLYGAVMKLLVLLVITTFLVYFILNTKDRISGEFKKSFSDLGSKASELTRFSGRQLSVVSALILLNLSFGYILKAYGLVYSPRGIAFGASYTDMNVTLRFYRILSVASLISAAIVFWSIMKSKIKPIFISIFVIIILIASESITSILVQKFVVKPNEKEIEQPYIKYNIDYTRKAFGLDGIQVKDFEVKDNLTKESIENNRQTVDNMRINSYKPAMEFYNQVQIIRYYYDFNDIDIDRYKINGKYNQVFVGAREIDSSTIQQNTWQNKHLIYTHGYGIAMNKVNTVTPEGQPDFVIKDIPSKNSTDIDLKNPRIYFGEKTNTYAIVNTDMEEFDYPKGGDNSNNKYDGSSGIKMSFINKVLFSINQRDVNFMLSKDINKDSKTLIGRNVKERAEKIAPFLKYDGDPYVVINDGKLYWMLDAYTTSDKYPFSQPFNDVNYIRNSVKVVIDAYDGTTDFYVVDKNDPLIMSYMKIFPGLFKSVEDMPKGFKEHFKYPEGIFDIQCNVMGKYHVTDPGVFYNGEDLWEVAKDQSQVEGDKKAQEAPYVVMKLPGENSEEMVLLKYFNMRNKDNMVALLGARMDNGNYGNASLYKFPPQKTIYSPYLFKQKFNQDTNISKDLSLWNKEGSQVQFGDTMIIPIDSSLLYVEPVYLRASGKNSIPEMKRIIVSYSDKIVIAENMEGALKQLFSIDAKDQNSKDSGEGKPQESSEKNEKLKQAKVNYDKAMEAQKNGDWAKYGEYIKELGKLLGEMNN